MTTVLIVCGAGASSTFLASRMRSLATARDLELDIRAASDAELPARLAATNILLVGPHLAKSFGRMQATAKAADALAELLPLDAFGPTGAEHALERVLALLAGSTETQIEGAAHG